MKTYGESGGIGPPFLSSALDGGIKILRVAVFEFENA